MNTTLIIDDSALLCLQADKLFKLTIAVDTDYSALANCFKTLSATFANLERQINLLHTDNRVNVSVCQQCVECSALFRAKTNRKKYCSQTCYYRKNKRDFRRNHPKTV